MPKHHTIDFGLVRDDLEGATEWPDFKTRVKIVVAILSTAFVVTRAGAAVITGIRTGYLLNQRAKPFRYGYSLTKEYLADDLEWEDFIYYAAPGVAQQLWDRYQYAEIGSSPPSRSGNADEEISGGGGTKKKKTKPSAHYIPKAKSWLTFEERCRARQRRGRQCVRALGHSGRHQYK